MSGNVTDVIDEQRVVDFQEETTSVVYFLTDVPTKGTCEVSVVSPALLKNEMPNRFNNNLLTEDAFAKNVVPRIEAFFRKPVKVKTYSVSRAEREDSRYRDYVGNVTIVI